MTVATANYRHMTARFNGKCADCARFLPAGAEIIYNFDVRKAYCADVEDCWHATQERKAAPVVVTAPEAPAIVATSAISKGYYTVALEDGSHVTIRIRPHWEADKAEAGAMVAGYLTGSNNESDYAGFAFIERGSVKVWGKFRTGYDRIKLALGVLVGDESARKAAGAAYAIESGNCYRCNRLLTVESSIAAGLGPDCAGKVGL